MEREHCRPSGLLGLVAVSPIELPKVPGKLRRSGDCPDATNHLCRMCKKRLRKPFTGRPVVAYISNMRDLERGWVAWHRTRVAIAGGDQQRPGRVGADSEGLDQPWRGGGGQLR